MSASSRTWLFGCLLVSILLGASFVSSSAQTQSASPISISISPRIAGSAVARQVVIAHVPAGSSATAVLFDPAGGQAVLQQNVGSDGTASVTLTPPAGGWIQGVYRVVVRTDSFLATSATFVVTDGQPHLYELPELPSPTSALGFAGTGLPANQSLQLVLTLGNDRGDREFTVTTDGDGVFSTFIWPQQLNVPFLEAGIYRVSLPSLNLRAVFTVREHPIGAALAVTNQPVTSDTLRVHLTNYHRYQYVWAIYADMSGDEQGEFLFGPTDIAGKQDATVTVPALVSGSYLLASPLDWGETQFSVDLPTDTPTPTETATPTSTATSTPTPTATPKPLPTPKKRCKKKGKKHTKCKPR